MVQRQSIEAMYYRAGSLTRLGFNYDYYIIVPIITDWYRTQY